MVRHVRPDTGNIERLRERVAAHFESSPLSEIGNRINDQLKLLDMVTNWTGLTDNHKQQFVHQCDNILQIVPAANRITSRFWFDHAMIRNAFGNVSEASNLLPGSILPRATFEWQYSGVHIPNLTPEKMLRIDIIGFPGDDDTEAVNLLTYPWLYHELGHLILSRSNKSFSENVKRILDEMHLEIRQLRLGKAHAVQERSNFICEKVEAAWRPSPNHTDWSHEIATDIIALWSCGPSFLAAYEDSLDGRKPYVIDDVHPPYEIRTLAILEASKRLGWESYNEPLLENMRRWTESDAGGLDHDIYMALRKQELIDAVVTSSLDCCGALSLPRCDLQTLRDIEAMLSANATPDFGRPVIIASWMRYNEFADESKKYHDWERTTVQQMANATIP